MSAALTQTFVIPVVAVGKPRMTRADSWKKRECVVRYWAYADEIRRHCTGVLDTPDTVSWKAYFPFPESYSKRKRESLSGKAHRVKPDRDNIDKGILDALWKDDQGVAVGFIGKFWDDGRGARIELQVSEEMT